VNVTQRRSDVKQKGENKMGSDLTQKEKGMVKELDDIYTVIAMDYWNIEKYPKEIRTSVLELQRRQAIVGEIVTQYTLIDEGMSEEICKYFFGSSESSIQLWRTKKFQNFNYYILERLYVLQKLRLLGTFCEIPKNISQNVERLDALRNAVAHAFFPENLKDYKKWRKVVYKGKDIFTLEGIKLFREDMDSVNAFFLSKYKG
jgi:hypothetical protein